VIRLLLDQGLPRSTVDLLNRDGWDVVHVAQCGLSAAADEQILEYARANNRAICTLDADFHALLAVSGASGPSTIRLRREGLRGPDVAQLLKRVWSEVAESLQNGALVTASLDFWQESRRIRVGIADKNNNDETGWANGMAVAAGRSTTPLRKVQG
jgi:predicted nuclease of predicted toxin-antitoxin system